MTEPDVDTPILPLLSHVFQVCMYLDEEENTLTIEFGKGRNVQMALNNDAEKEIVQAFLDDPNTWAVFLNALSLPLQEHA